MKKIRAVWITGIILLTSVLTHAQNNVPQSAVIQPEALSVTFLKTTNLIFPYAVKSVDKGSKDIMVQIAKGVENILQLKAAVQGFKETNLTVITADGKLYSYIVNYTDRPIALNVQAGLKAGSTAGQAMFSVTTDNEASIQDLAEQVSTRSPVLNGIKDAKYDISLQLEGIYIKGQMLYFQLQLANNSNIAYDIDQLRFYIRDQKKAKRTATQESELLPQQVTGNARIIRGQSRQTVVASIPKFTIPDKKILIVQLMEKQGGRHLELKIKNRSIIGAKVIR
ncbi:conjugative transposon protein TraN [Pedobacter sp. ISL-68]|uniref:conjugative transposon protein TraN n=1 Tax=unclassified Pedobacter TaxID=2628915 RepID=UPI001BEAC64D|nr:MULTISPECIES: conjugative transposon protein TraN [unclassified Pedobacter]MBT2561289.1 conjugative transposon protein TraN [Pedobacter sp. ISL-64]MBT2590679.1 conjugative transposon protein TraN [Pedobacter sp. ISL-68]